MVLIKNTESNPITRGFRTKAYPAASQVDNIWDMQPSMRYVWNWLVDLWEGHLRRQEQWATKEGHVGAVPTRPDYKGMSPEEATAAKAAHKVTCRERRNKITEACKAAGSSSPQHLPFSAASGKPSVVSRCASFGYTPAKTHPYQVLNFVLRERGLPELPKDYLDSLYKSYKASLSAKKVPKKRKDCDVMPIKVRSGKCVRLQQVGPHNASVKLPGVEGRIPIRVDKGTLCKILSPGVDWVEGVTLTYEHGTWWCSLLYYLQKNCTQIYGLRKTSDKAKPQEVLIDSGNGPFVGTCIGIDPGLSDLVTTNSGFKIHNLRNREYLRARDVALGVMKLLDNTGQESAEIISEIYRLDAKMRRRVLEPLRQYAASVDQTTDIVFVERNTGIALGIGQGGYVGATKLLISVLRAKLGWDRVIEVDSFYNSQTCPECGLRDKKTWARKCGQKDQTCTCLNCGYTADRDVASGQNILNRGIIEFADIVRGRSSNLTAEPLAASYPDKNIHKSVDIACCT